MTTTKHAVIGFLFDEMNRVLLVNKIKPDWQAGKWNGIGGKVEAGESIGKAMAREFWEETGILIPISVWRHFADVSGRGAWTIHIYAARVGNMKFLDFDPTAGLITNFPTHNDAGEKLHAYFPHSIDVLPLVEHMTWLVPLALATLNSEANNFTIMETE